MKYLHRVHEQGKWWKSDWNTISLYLYLSPSFCLRSPFSI